MKKKLLLSLLLSIPLSSLFSQTYYLTPGIEPIEINDVSNWNTNPAGGGSTPADFTGSSAVWDINGYRTYLSNDLSIAGELRNTGSADTMDVQGHDLTLQGVVNGANIFVTDGYPIPILSSSVVDYADVSTDIKDIISGTYSNLTLSGANTFSAAGDISISNDLSTSGSSDLGIDMNGHDLLDGGSFAVGSIGTGLFTIETQSTSSTPIPSDIVWPIGTQVRFNANTLFDQTIPSGRYNELFLAGSGSKIIEAGDTVSVRSVFYNSVELVLEATSSDYAQFKSDVTMTNTGVVTKQHYMDISTAKYFHRGTALDGADLQDFNNGQTMTFASDNTGSVWEWDASTSEWVEPSPTGNAATTAYAIYAGNAAGLDYLLSATGTVEVSATNTHYQPVNATLQYDNSGDPADFVDAVIDGWNFVANPFLGNYDFANHDLNGSTAGTMADYYYVFNGTNYSFYQISSGTGTGGGASTGSPATQYIAPGQGVWFRTSSGWSGTTTFAASNVNMGGTAQMYKTTAPSDILKLQVTESVSGLADQVIIRFKAGATDAEDFSLDVPKKSNPGNVPNTYIKLGNGTYALCAADFSRTSFPLHFADIDDKQLMEFSIVQNSISMYNKVFIEDKKNNSFTELTAGNYSFANDVAYGADRFVIHFQNTVGLPEGMIEKTAYDVYYGNGALNFVFQQNDFKPTTGTLYSLQGKAVYTFDVQEPNASIQLPSVATGIYLLSIEGDVSGARKVYIK